MSYWQQLAPIVFNGFTGTSITITVPRDAGGMVVSSIFGQGVSLGSTCAYRAVFEWSLDSAFSNIVARRQYVVRAGDAQGGLNPASGGTATMATPHFGEYLRITLVAPTLTTFQSVTFRITHRSDPLSYWGTPLFSGIAAGDTFSNTQALIPFTTNAAVAAGATMSVRSLWPYEGPALVTYRGNFNAAAVGDWQVLVFAEDENGTGNRLATWQAVPGTIYTAHLTEQIIVPPGAILLQATNGTAAAKSMSLGLTADYSRMAA